MKEIKKRAEVEAEEGGLLGAIKAEKEAAGEIIEKIRLDGASLLIANPSLEKFTTERFSYLDIYSSFTLDLHLLILKCLFFTFTLLLWRVCFNFVILC
jgi:hypothetical protein